MGIARRRLHLCVTEEFSDHRKPVAGRHGGRGEGVTQIVDAHILDTGPFADSPPWWLEVSEVGAWVLAGDDPGVVFNPFDLAEHLQCGCADVDRLCSGLGIRQVERRSFEIDVVPLEGHDLRQSAAGENQKAQGIDGRLALNAFLFALPQDLSKPGKFILGQIALSFLLGVLLDVSACLLYTSPSPRDS